MKKIISLILALLTVISTVAASAVTLNAEVSGDPADSYVRKTAANEDSDISMWFEHPNVKVFQEDHTSSGRDTYSVYMAKNEYQGTQVVLYSPAVSKSGLTATISEFTAMDGSGNTLSADVYYEMYIKVDNLDTTDVLGVDDPADSFIREGHIPDAMAAVSEINSGTGIFGLTAGKSQTLYIKVKSELTSAPGWYSATFNVTDSDGNAVKTATVYAHVWDFEIPEANHYQTSINTDYGNDEKTYKKVYDYFLDNRLNLMKIPGNLDSSNPYLTNPRVTAIGIADKGSYLGFLTTDQISAIYDDLSTMDEWESVKEKAYFYTADEPRSKQQKDGNPAIAGSPTVADVLTAYNKVAAGWENPYTVVPFDENHPYPDGYNKEVAFNGTTYITENDGSGRFRGLTDAIQGLFNDTSVTIWCPKMNVFTPTSVLQSAGYAGTPRVAKVKSHNGIISGFNCYNTAAYYFNWDSIFGWFPERLANYRSMKADQGKNIKLWWYACGKNPDYTYCNHVIENTGLQTELMFWQSMQVGSEGYLYYASNSWSENGVVYVDGSSKSFDGSMVSGKWRVNKYSDRGHDVYGNGVLYYGSDVKSALRINNPKSPLGTIRVEHIRDGIEDYEMLYMYRERFGEEAMQDFITKVSDNVCCYISMPGFDRSEWSADLSDEDVFAAVRIELGNAVESSDPVPCEHAWNAGVVVKEPTYTEKGEKKFTCTKCKETKTEEIDVIPPLLGDANGDFDVNSRDSRLIKQFIVDKADLSELIFVNADIDGDGEITSKDSRAIKKLIVAQ